MTRSRDIIETAKLLAPVGRQKELAILILYVRDHSPSQVAKALSLSPSHAKTLMDHAILCWRKEPDFKSAYNAALETLGGAPCPTCGRSTGLARKP